MKKTLSAILSVLLVISMLCGMLGTMAFAADGEVGSQNEADSDNGSGKYDKSKTATELYDDRYTDVTLSVPGEVETLSTDIVFVIDKSSSDKLSSNFANGLFEQLIAVQKDSGASIKIGVVIYNYDGHVALPLTELTADNYQTLLDSLPTFKSGTNADAGLVLAKQMLDADTKVDASRKHVILIGDGLNWAFDVNGKPHTTLIKKDENATTTLYGAGTTSWLEGRDVSSSYEIPYGWTWDEYWSNVTSWVEADGDKYVFDITNYGGEDTSNPKPSYNSADALASAVLLGEVRSHALNMDRALYDTWESYTALQNAGYNCNAYYTGSSSTNIGYNIMKMLAGTSSMDFDDIKCDILYSVSKGSTVVDYIGYSDDAEEGYDFDFIDQIGDELKLPVLKVGNAVYFTKKLATPVDGAAASYVFSATEDADPTFAMDYYRGNGTTEEHFVWTINEDVSRFAPVSLTYTLDLVVRSEIPGVHDNVDTNQKATLYPKDSDGNDGSPEDFEKPKVKYEVPAQPIEVVLGGEKLLDGVQAGGYRFVLLNNGEEIEIVTSDDDGIFEFTALTYDKADVFEYEIREVIGYDTTIIYDNSVYTVKVTVTNDNNVLNAVVTYEKNGETYEGEIRFNNQTVVPVVEEETTTTETTTSEPEEIIEEITDPEVPLAPSVPDDTEDFEEIDDPDIPLASVPQTGDTFSVWFVVSGVIACALCAVIIFSRKKEENA